MYTEHSWINRQDDQSGFIDIVLQDREAHLIVECKRVKNATWVFIPEDGIAKPRRQAKAWVSRQGLYFGWHDLWVDPMCSEATYCAVHGQASDGRNPMLERICGELVSATEAFATEHVDYYRDPAMPPRRFYFNVVVTTAELKVAQFQPGDISLKEGTLDKATSTAQDVPYIRFRKQMSLRERRLTFDDYKSEVKPNVAKENTVFVVRASALLDFLKAFELPGDTLARFA